MSITPERALDKAKLAFMRTPNTAFITTILFNLSQVWEKSIPTLAVDGVNLYINPDYFVKLDEEERMFGLGHECWHVALDHLDRAEGLDFRRWNFAGDYVINDMQILAGMKMPQGGLHDVQYRDMSTRQVYDLLPDPPKDFETDIIPINKKADKTEQEIVRQKIKNILVKAKNASLMSDKPGTIPGEVERGIYDMLNPLLPWEGLLHQYMSAYQKNDYSYARRNKRYDDIFLPTLYSEALDTLATAIDVSGSITNEQLQAFLSEIQYIQQTMRPNKLKILGFETCITKEYDVELGDDLSKLSFPGGGGTSITPVLEKFEKEQPTVAIIFTDMQFEYYTIEPTFDIIWVMIDAPNVEPRHGRGIYYDSRRHKC